MNFPTTLDKPLRAGRRFPATLIAFAIIPISGLATDIYLPSMPAMAKSLGQPQTSIQLTLSLFLISYGVSQFFAGIVVDAVGRYKVSVLSMFLFIISFWATAQTKNIYIIYSMRIVHGALSALAVVSKRAFFVDVYEGKQRKNYLSVMTIVWSLGPIVAPFIGGYLQKNFGWQSNFNALAIYSAIMLLLELAINGETIPVKKPFDRKNTADTFATMLRTPDFFYGTIMCGLSYGLVIFFNLSGAFIIEHRFGYTPITTGYVSLSMGLAWMSGGFIGRALIDRPLLPKLQVANALQLIVIAVMFWSASSVANLYSLAVFAFLVHTGAGFVFNIYFSYCVGRFPESAGLAGGLAGGISFISTSVISYAVAALIHPQNQMNVAAGYFIIALLGLIVLIIIRFRRTQRSSGHYMVE